MKEQMNSKNVGTIFTLMDQLISMSEKDYLDLLKVIAVQEFHILHTKNVDYNK